MPTTDLEPPASYEPIEFGDAIIRRLRPATRRTSEPSRWEVSLGGAVVGWIDRHQLRGAAAAFYFATGIHPRSAKRYRLEGSTDFGERVEVICAFHRDPISGRQHLGLHSWTEQRTGL